MDAQTTRQRPASALLAAQLLDCYGLPPESARLEALDALLEDAGIVDSEARDKVLTLLDKTAVKVQAARLDLARLLLRCGVDTLDEGERQLRMTFG